MGGVDLYECVYGVWMNVWLESLGFFFLCAMAYEGSLLSTASLGRRSV